MSLNQLLTQNDIEEQFNTRRLIYENRETFYDIAKNDDIEDDPECKDITENIIKK